MKSFTKQITLVLAVVASVAVVSVGCKEKTDAEKAQDAAGAAKDDVKDAASKTGDAVKDAAVATKDAVTNAVGNMTSTNK